MTQVFALGKSLKDHVRAQTVFEREQRVGRDVAYILPSFLSDFLT